MARFNHVAATALEEFADLLSIVGDDPFRVHAYEKAARSVAVYPRDLGTLDRKGLLAIQGIGTHIADKLIELRETGRIAALDALHARVPPGVRALLDIPGLGPRHAHQFYAELGITSVAELESALTEGRLHHLVGWGPKSESKLQESIRQLRESEGRMEVGRALDLAEEMIHWLGRLPEVERIAYAGSLRRMSETIGDVDLLVASARPDPIMEAFRTHAGVDRVLGSGSTKSSILTERGIQVDLRVVAPQVWGAALIYFTGSKAHNIKLRVRALEAGMTLSEYGLHRIDNGELIAAGTEEEVYRAL